MIILREQFSKTNANPQHFSNFVELSERVINHIL